MATRFYLTASPYTDNTPAFDAGWEQTAEGSRFKLLRKTRMEQAVATSNESVTVPITTTQDILNCQFISEPIPPQRIIGTVSLVIRCSEDATTTNVALAALFKVVSQDCSTVRGTLFSVFGTGTEFALTAAPETRIISAQAVTALTTQPGDRLVVEVGVTATAPTVAGSALQRVIFDPALADYALTATLTTSLNPWVEFSQDIWDNDFNNYQSVRVGNGMSTGERIR